MNAKRIKMVLAIFAAVALAAALAVAQAPPAGGQGGGAGRGGGGAGRGGAGGGRGGGPALTVTTTAFADGDVIPAKFTNAGGSTSPAFDFKWMMGTADAMAPATLASYAIVFHDIENSANRGTGDTLHWMAWDFPGTLKGIPEGLMMGDLADGTKQSATAAIGRGRYFGPGAGPGPYHHYVFEFYALDAKLNLPNTATRAEVMAAMEGHVVGKAAYVGRYHQ